MADYREMVRKSLRHASAQHGASHLLESAKAMPRMLYALHVGHPVHAPTQRLPDQPEAMELVVRFEEIHVFVRLEWMLFGVGPLPLARPPAVDGDDAPSVVEGIPDGVGRIEVLAAAVGGLSGIAVVSNWNVKQCC